MAMNCCWSTGDAEAGRRQHVLEAHAAGLAGAGECRQRGEHEGEFLRFARPGIVRHPPVGRKDRARQPNVLRAPARCRRGGRPAANSCAVAAAAETGSMPKWTSAGLRPAEVVGQRPRGDGAALEPERGPAICRRRREEAASVGPAGPARPNPYAAGAPFITSASPSAPLPRSSAAWPAARPVSGSSRRCAIAPRPPGIGARDRLRVSRAACRSGRSGSRRRCRLSASRRTRRPSAPFRRASAIRLSSIGSKCVAAITLSVHCSSVLARRERI